MIVAVPAADEMPASWWRGRPGGRQLGAEHLVQLWSERGEEGDQGVVGGLVGGGSRWAERGATTLNA